jgi:hypothetical protein
MDEVTEEYKEAFHRYREANEERMLFTVIIVKSSKVIGKNSAVLHSLKHKFEYVGSVILQEESFRKNHHSHSLATKFAMHPETLLLPTLRRRISASARECQC